MHKVTKFKKHLKLDYNKMKKQDKVNNDVRMMTNNMSKMKVDESSDDESENKPIKSIKKSIKPLKFRF